MRRDTALWVVSSVLCVMAVVLGVAISHESPYLACLMLFVTGGTVQYMLNNQMMWILGGMWRLDRERTIQYLDREFFTSGDSKKDNEQSK